jgi:hypothetical protein
VQLGDPGNAPEPDEPEPVEALTPTATATASPTVSPTATATATATATSTSTPTPTATPVPDIINADFEQGPVGWEVIPDDGRTLITRDLPHGITAHSGEWVARLGDGTDSLWGIGQVITVPADRPFLSFWYRVQSDKPQCDDDDWARLAFVPDGENPYIIDDYLLCDRAVTDHWLRRVYDLRPVAGKRGTLAWSLIRQGNFNTSIFIDTITFQAEEGPGLFNGDFEEKLNSWEEVVAPNQRIIRSDLPDSIQPQSGEWAAWLGGEHGRSIFYPFPPLVSSIVQNITFPSDAKYLTYWYARASDVPCTNEATAIVAISIVPPGNQSGTAIYLDTLYLCPSLATNEWKQRTLDVSNYQGQSFNLGIVVTGTSPRNSDFFVDAIAFQDAAFNDITQQSLAADQSDATLSIAPYLSDHAQAGLDQLLQTLHMNAGGR